MEKRLLVVGARPHSLGYHVASLASAAGWMVSTAGVHEEDVPLDVVKPSPLHRLMEEEQPHSIVCTVGINIPNSSVLRPSFDRSFTEQMEINCFGPIRVLREWTRFWKRQLVSTYEDQGWQVPMHFAAISSNSARIARSTSAGYCASKAALSMALRCIARELAEERFSIYSYEPGWLDSTPMSQDLQREIADGAPLHRIPGERTLNPVSLAGMIVHNLSTENRWLNGCTLRLDGGEQ